MPVIVVVELENVKNDTEEDFGLAMGLDVEDDSPSLLLILLSDGVKEEDDMGDEDKSDDCTAARDTETD